MVVAQIFSPSARKYISKADRPVAYQPQLVELWDDELIDELWDDGDELEAQPEPQRLEMAGPPDCRPRWMRNENSRKLVPFSGIAKLEVLKNEYALSSPPVLI